MKGYDKLISDLSQKKKSGEERQTTVIPADWNIFFQIDIGTAIALIGLIFISFTVYNASASVDPLEKNLITIYFFETLVSFVIALTAIIPPHWWWAGALFLSLFQLSHAITTFKQVTPYRRAYRFHRSTKNEQLPPALIREWFVRGALYKSHKAHFDAIFVPILEALTVLVAGLMGGAEYFHILPQVISSGFPIALAGWLSALFLVSASAGSWYLLFNIVRPGDNTPFIIPSTKASVTQTSKSPVLVIGASGYLGGLICKYLSEADYPVRALVRVPTDYLGRLGVEMVKADLNDPFTLPYAVAGCYTIIYTANTIAPSRRGEIVTGDAERAKRLIDIAQHTGVKQFVFVSGVIPDQAYSGLMDSKREVEKCLKNSSMDWTIIKAGALMEVHLALLGSSTPTVEVEPGLLHTVERPLVRNHYESIRHNVEQKGVTTIIGDGKSLNSWVATKDVAEIAIKVLDNPACKGVTIELGGKPITWNESVEMFSHVLGREIKVRYEPLWKMRLLVKCLRVIAPVAAEAIAPSVEAAEFDMGTNDMLFRQLFPLYHLQTIEEFLEERLDVSQVPVPRK